MALVYKKNEKWYLNGSKHLGRTLEEVAEKDPKYIWWVWDKVGPSMDDETYFAVEATMYKKKIAFAKKKKKTKKIQEK